MDRSTAVPKRCLEVENRRTPEAVFIARDTEHRELSDVAGMIWRLSNGRRTVAQIAMQISDVYAVDEATATTDLLDFLDELARDRFITWTLPDGDTVATG